MGKHHLLIVGLHAEEDEVGCGTGQAALQVGAAPDLLSLRVKTIEGLHGLFKELPLNLEGERQTVSLPKVGTIPGGAGITSLGPHEWEAVKYWYPGMTEKRQAGQSPGSRRPGVRPDLSVN